MKPYCPWKALWILNKFLTGFGKFETADFFGFCWIRWFGSWDFDFQNLNLGNETADLILTRGGLGLGVVALWGAHARQMSETAMSIPLFCFVFGQLAGVLVEPKPLERENEIEADQDTDQEPPDSLA